jgi:hypothetical protein
LAIAGRQPRVGSLAELERRESRYKLPMHITSAHILPIATLATGVLVLLMPRCLSYAVAIYLIAVGLTGLNGVYHFVNEIMLR